MQIKDKKEKAQSYARIRLNKYGPNDSIVLFSGSRQSYPGLGSVFLSEPDIYLPILEVGKMVKRGDIMKGNSFTDRSLRNLALNLCAYRYLYENHQRQYGSIAAALGYGIGEVAAATVAGIIDIESAFGLIKRHSTMVEANESKFPSCIALIQHNKKSRIHEACRDARNFLETSCGFEFISEADKSAMHDPITRLPTTVQIISSYGQNKAIIGGHPNGVKFILQNKRHFGITNGYLMNSPALNTYQYSHIEQRLSTFLQNIGKVRKLSVRLYRSH